jgi:hypothetical protein
MLGCRSALRSLWHPLERRSRRDRGAVSNETYWLSEDLEALSFTEHMSTAVDMLPVIETEYQVVRAALSMELRRSE